jgi:tetratricopeptide (TPR) repeat protein
MSPSNSEVLLALSRVARRQQHWDEAIAHSEQALALDPRNVESLMDAAITHAQLREFPTVLKLYDRVLDIMPTDPDVKAYKARIYQAQGNLQEAAKLLVDVNARTPSNEAFVTKLGQLQLERNLDQAVRLQQARLAQSHYDSEYAKALDQSNLAFEQRLAGDSAGAKVNGEQARNVLEQLRRNQPDNVDFAVYLSGAYSVTGQKDSALKEAKRAIVLCSRAKSPGYRLGAEEYLAAIQTIFGENSSAISTLSRLLQMPYTGWLYTMPITPALLRLDPLWDPLRGDPAFQKLCEEKQALTTNGH